jgi:hypothetical protein
MEPIRHTKTARLRSLKMYREELDQLVALFRKSCESVVISDNRNRYDSLDEMSATAGSRIKNLDIRGERPGVHFLLNQKEYPPGSATPAIFNELRTEEITEGAEALFFKIREFLYAHQRPSNTRFVIPAIAALIAAFGLTVYSTVARVLHGQQSDLPSTFPPIPLKSVAAFIAAAVFFVILGVANSQNHLILETRRNSPSFFVRNRDELFKQGIIALMSGLVGWLLGHFGK